MSHFPIVNSVDQSIVNAIEKVDKVKFSGTKVFAALRCFIGDTNVKDGIIGNSSYTQFNYLESVNKGIKKIPPMLMSIDVKTAGSMGAIKKAEAVIKFANMADAIANNGFMQIGKTQCLVWGWAKDRNGEQLSVGIDINTAKTALNAAKHYEAVVGKDFDIHAGILTNFSLKVNEDMTVDVTIELSQPSDIPAFLALNNKLSGKRFEKTEDETSKGTALAAQAAKLDPDSEGAEYTKLLQYTINIQNEVFDGTFGNTETPYIQLGYIVKTICNKGKDKKMGTTPVDIQINESIATGRPRMISCSENVIIPCPKLPETNTDEEKEIDGKKVKVLALTANNIAFGPVKLAYDMQFPEPSEKSYHGVTFAAEQWGYIKNIFISSDFVKEAAKGAESNKDFLEKIIDELNIAGAGLWNLALRDIESEKGGHMVYTIVDYNISHDVVPPPSLDLFSPNSTITNVDLQADLPKELAAQAMMGGKGQGGDVTPGSDIFSKTAGETDPVMGSFSDSATNYEENASGGGENDGKEEVPDDNKKSQTKKDVENVSKAVKYVMAKVSAAIGALKDSIMRMLNAPGEFRVKLNGKKYYASGEEISYFVVVKDAGIVKNLYFGEGAEKVKNALLPVKLTFTTLGVGGFVIGRALTIPYIPWFAGRGYWQITDVQQKIDDTKWEIDVEVRFRINFDK
jgi:hypothetical protein